MASAYQGGATVGRPRTIDLSSGSRRRHLLASLPRRGPSALALAPFMRWDRVVAMLSRCLDELTTKGYSVLEGVHSPEDVHLFRAALGRIHATLGSPPLTAPTKTDVGPSCVMSAVGLVVARLLEHAPELAPRVLHPLVRAVLLGSLGPDLEIEVIAGAVSDSARAMLPWHTHIGGPDEDLVDPSAACRTLAPRRLSLLVYLDELAPGAGQLMIFPRRQRDPVAQPFPDARAPWSGQVTLSCGVGTAVLLDERTWHAAGTRSSPGLRRFVGGQFVRSAAERATRADLALAGLRGALLGGPAGGG